MCACYHHAHPPPHRHTSTPTHIHTISSSHNHTIASSHIPSFSHTLILTYPHSHIPSFSHILILNQSHPHTISHNHTLSQVDEATVQQLLPYLLAGLAPSAAFELCCATAMVIAQLASVATLGVDLLQGVYCGGVGWGGGGGRWEGVLHQKNTCEYVHICFHTTYPHTTYPHTTYPHTTYHPPHHIPTAQHTHTQHTPPSHKTAIQVESVKASQRQPALLPHMMLLLAHLASTQPHTQPLTHTAFHLLITTIPTPAMLAALAPLSQSPAARRFVDHVVHRAVDGAVDQNVDHNVDQREGISGHAAYMQVVVELLPQLSQASAGALAAHVLSQVAAGAHGDGEVQATVLKHIDMRFPQQVWVGGWCRGGICVCHSSQGCCLCMQWWTTYITNTPCVIVHYT